MWPQYTLMAIQLLGIGIVLSRWGQPREDTYGGWAFVIAVAVNWSMLYYGGFFKGM